MHLHKTNVLVAGAGPVGLTTALMLNEHGQQVLVAEEKAGPVTHSYALALHPASLDLLKPLGVLDDLFRRARRLDRLAIYAGAQRLAAVPLAAGGEHPFAAALGQDVLEDVLGRALAARGVPVWWNHRCARFTEDAGAVSVQLDQLEERGMGYAVARQDRVVARTRFVAADHLVGADGHGSLVRTALDLDFPEVAPAQHFAVFEFRHSEPLPDEIAIVLHEDGVGVLWPLPDGFARWSFAVDATRNPGAWREKNHEPVQIVPTGIFPALSDDFFARLLRERAPWFQGDPEEIHWRMLVRFERRLVTTFGHGHTWLAGDAAHLAGPVGVQSMNAGLAEARVLADALAQPTSRDERLKQLHHYNEAARRHWRHLLGLTGKNEAEPDADPIIRQYRHELLACLPATGAALTNLAAALRLRVDPVHFEIPFVYAGG